MQHIYLSIAKLDVMTTLYCIVLTIAMLIGTSEARICPAYCYNGTLVPVSNCGDLGYCCGTYQRPSCCTDYIEELSDTQLTATRATSNCSQVLAQETLSASQRSGETVTQSREFIFRVLSISTLTILMAIYL